MLYPGYITDATFLNKIRTIAQVGTNSYPDMKTMKFLVMVLLASLFIGQGCEKSPALYGRLIVGISDDPFPVEIIEEASIRVFKFEAHPMDAEEDEDMILLLEDTMYFDLIKLRNGVVENLIDTEIIAGKYDYFRLYVYQADLKIIDGDSYSVKVPSGSTSGIKVKVDPAIEVAEGLSEELILDIDLSKSFVLNGSLDTPAGIKGFNFKPVIRAINLSETGRIEGLVKDAESNPVNGVSLTAELDSESYTTFSDSTGYYNIIGLPTGIYSLTAEEDGFETVYLQDVVVVAGNKTTRNITLLK